MMPQEIKHVRSVDALRGLAACAVVLVHVTVFIRPEGLAYMIGFAGQRGVQLFYILSAFTLCLSVDSREREEQFPIINFYVRRLFRVAPLFYAALVMNLLYHWYLGDLKTAQGLGRDNILLAVVFLHGISPAAINAVVIGGWSIAVEMMFYAVFPFFRVALNNLLRAVIGFAIIATACHSISWYLAPSSGWQFGEYYTFLWFPVELPVFCIGIIVYHLWRLVTAPQSWLRNALLERKVLGIPRRWVLSVLCFVIAAIGFWRPLPISNAKLLPSSLFLALFVFSMLLAEWPLLVNRFMLHLGKISYSIYLTHFFVLIAVEQTVRRLEASTKFKPLGTVWGWLVVLAVVLPLAILVATISQKYIEAPGVALGRRIVSYIESGLPKLGRRIRSA